jgi:ATP adenylyltransferase
MTKPLWAPWRLEYIKGAEEHAGCVFCDEANGAIGADESLLVREGDEAVAILNKYPYSSGHLMVAPRRHVGTLGELTPEEVLEILARRGGHGRARLYSPGSFNWDGISGTWPARASRITIHLHVVPAGRAF